MQVEPRSRRAAAGSPAFYSLASVRQAQFPCGKQSFACVQLTVEWLSDRVTLDRLPLLFSQRGIARSLANAASPPTSPSHAVVPVVAAAAASGHDAKQQHVVVVNPLRAAALQHHSVADVCVRNPLFANGKAVGKAAAPSTVCRVDWDTEYALHSAARAGDPQAVLSQVENGPERVFLCMERDGAGWMPLHYAAW